MLRGAARRLRPASARALLAGAPEQPLARSCAGFHASPSAFADDVPRNSLGRTRNPLLSTTGICLVPQQSVFVVERLGRFNRVLEPGLHLVIPVVDRVAYTWSLKEEAIPIHAQTAITRDNVAISIDGVLYIRVVDPKLASYGVENLLYAVVQLAQSAMRNELGKISLDKTFEERDALNHNIVRVINEASTAWGLQCLRYEIRDIAPPRSISIAMEMQAEAERRKRASVLESEGERQAAINRAEGQKQKTILESEAAMLDTANRARGEAEAILARATATARSVELLSAALAAPGGQQAAQLRVAEQWLTAFGGIAKASTTLLLPAAASDPGAMVAQALSVFRTMQTAGGAATPAAQPEATQDGESPALPPPPTSRISASASASREDDSSKLLRGFSLQKH